MIKKFLLQLLVKWYFNHIDEIVKLDDFEELKAYRFNDIEATQKIIKRNITAQTLWHFHALSDEERWMAKGAAGVLMIMRDANIKALKIFNQDDPDRSLEEWRKWKKKVRTN